MSGGSPVRAGAGGALTAAVGGRVGRIHVVAGQTVEKDEILMDMLPPDEELDDAR